MEDMDEVDLAEVELELDLWTVAPQRAVGKTIAEVTEYGFRSEVWFTDGTKLQIVPGEMDADGDRAPALIFHDWADGRCLAGAEADDDCHGGNPCRCMERKGLAGPWG
jgi:hypothetical protein